MTTETPSADTAQAPANGERPRIAVSKTGATEVSGPPKVRIQDLFFSYGHGDSLKNISLSLYDRTTTAFIGPSGCGKSTLLRTLNRIYDLYPGQVARGTIELEGRNLLDPKLDVAWLRSKVGMVFQKPTPFPMSIYDNIAFGVRLYEKLSRADMDERVEWALRKAALWGEVKDKLQQPGTSLSGGQQQRLCIARAIAVKPEVLLMDEPTSALDPISTSYVEDLVNELSKDYCIAIVTHNMQQAARVSNFTAFMFLGELIEYGQTEQVFVNPSDPRTSDYITGRFG